jgi:D-inositol-3-phosphate glycosyltransferase
MVNRIAVLSVHSCPKAALGGKETGGMNVYVRELSREMGRRGIGVDVFTRSQNPLICPIGRIGPKVRVIHVRAGPEEPIPKNQLFQYLPDFVHEVKEFATANRLRYDLIHSHYWLSGWVGGQLKYWWGIPLIHMFHTLGSLKNSLLRQRKLLEPRQRIMVEGEIMNWADGLIAPNPWEKEQMIRRYGVSSSKIQVIPCGVDLRVFRPIPPSKARAVLSLSPQPFILYVGRIDAIKGIDTLIRAIQWLARHPIHGKGNWGVIMIGGELDDDPRREDREIRRIRSLVTRKGLQKRVALWGAQNQDLLPYFYSAAEALVVPSRYESFGMVALEAMACGTLVIASEVGGLRYTIEDGKTGFLFPEGDWRALGQKIARILENPAFKEKFSSAAIARARAYAWDSITDQVLTFYDSLRKPNCPAV